MLGNSTTAITILFIIFAAGVGAFVRKRSRDKCLKDFGQNMVTLEDTAGKTIWGMLRVENTGLEFVYPQKNKDEQGHDEASYILYKYEYPKIGAVIRFHDELSELNKKAREKELKRTYHPTSLRRLKRRIKNVFKTIRDSVTEIVNIGHKVVLEMIKGDKIFEYCGVLKEYTAEFIEIMDVDYKANEDQPARTADLVVPRKLGVVRHLGE